MDPPTGKIDVFLHAGDCLLHASLWVSRALSVHAFLLFTRLPSPRVGTETQKYPNNNTLDNFRLLASEYRALIGVPGWPQWAKAQRL